MIVLLVDNDSEEHALFELALRRLDIGAQSYSATCCDDAIRQILEKTIPAPEFIFLDIDMPEVDGNACLKMITQLSSFDHIHVVVYSTLEYGADISYMLKHGASCHLNKSRSFVTFCSELKQILTQDAA